MRKCGSCRHFSDCGVAGSGNCLHDHRQHLFQVVLVRRTELACRNSFDQDLWEPIPHRADPASATGGVGYRPMAAADAPGLIAGGEDTPPAQGLGLPGRLHLRTPRSAGADEERPSTPSVVSQETGVIAEQPGGAGVREARRRRLALHEQEKRQAFEARTGVSMPEQTRRAPRSSQHSPSPTIDVVPAIDTGGSRVSATQDADQAHAGAHSQPVVSVEFSGRRPSQPAASNAAPPSAQTPEAGMQSASHASAPSGAPEPRRQVVTPRPRRDAAPPVRQAEREQRGNATSHQQQPVADGRRQVQPTEQFDVVVPAAPPTPRRTVPAQPATTTRPAPLPVPRTTAVRAATDTRSAPQATASQAHAARNQGAHAVSAYDANPQRSEPLTSAVSSSRLSSAMDEPLALPPRRQASSDLASARSQDPIDGTPRYAGVPRCCATCVSFQRMEGSSRGHCHNVHVFTVPHLVDSDDLACRSSMGSWWLPATGVAARGVTQREHERGRES